jgi:hypothetical protein
MDLLTTRHGVVAALVLALVHVLAGHLLERAETLPRRTRRDLLSAAAGASVAYVFVDVLPELSHYHHRLLEALGETEIRFAEQRLYVLVLLSFVVFYGLEHLVSARGEEHHAAEPARDAEGSAVPHFLAFAAYTALIGHLLVEEAERGAAPIAVYTAAMALHFVIVAHALWERFASSYARWGRWVLAASVLVGWGVAMKMEVSEAVFARLFAVVAGGVVITSVQRELPGGERGSFWPFLLGAVGFALLLLWS